MAEPAHYTKNDLIAFLQELEGNPEILLSSDEEGNSYHPFTGMYTDGLFKGNPVLIFYPGWGHVDLDE
jgi:hypothetical protein